MTTTQRQVTIEVPEDIAVCLLTWVQWEQGKDERAATVAIRAALAAYREAGE
jgi:hypothetical protein